MKKKTGRKSTFPRGSVMRKTLVPTPIEKALQAYRKRQEAIPSSNAVMLAALAKFLRESGDYRPTPL